MVFIRRLPARGLRYLIAAGPAAITAAELLARAVHGADRIKQFHVVDGIYWQAMRSDDTKVDPDIYGLAATA